MQSAIVASLSSRLLRSTLTSASKSKPSIIHFRAGSSCCSQKDHTNHNKKLVQINQVIRQDQRQLSLSTFNFAGVVNVEEQIIKEEVETAVAEELEESTANGNGEGGNGSGPPENVRNTEKDRTKVIPVETSIRYLKSDAYKQSYGGQPVWVMYRRNFKGQFAPKKTRKTCIRGGQIATGNPCPICRDEYLVLEYRNVELLKQFISQYNGEILSYDKTGICQRRHLELLVAIKKAKDYGTITFDVPFREYDYSEYENLYKSYAESKS